jgi:predicted metal-dependent HD superfamily phosphohydrolase
MPVLSPGLIDQIRRLYDEPHRRYHAWSHPQALLALLDEVRERLDDALAVECAILLHDAVYDPHRGDNEVRSVALAHDLLAGLVPDETLERTMRLIEATERHRVPESLPVDELNDMRFFLDLDLSVLGADEAAFDAYEAGVRAEYAHVTEPDFRLGRAAVLEGFLARDRLFLSEWGFNRFEAAGRANVLRSLDALRDS